MILIFGEHTNGQITLIGTAETDAQMRMIAQAIVQNSNWRDVYFLPTNVPEIYEIAKNYTGQYWLENPQLERKIADDPLILAALEAH